MSQHDKDVASSKTTQQAHHWMLAGYRVVTGLTVGVGVLVTALILDTLWRYKVSSAAPADVRGFLGLLILFAIVDSIPLVLRDVPVSLGFPVILLALLWATSRLPSADAAALVAVEVGTLGACLSGTVRSSRLDRGPINKSLARMLYYAAHHALAGFAAARAYGWSFSAWDPLWKLKNIHAQATLIYVLVYFMVSIVLFRPHDYLVDRLLLPADEKRFPRVTILSVITTAPVPMILLSTVGTEGGWVFTFLLLLYAALLVIASSWTTVEAQERRRRAREQFGEELGIPVNIDELAHKAKRILNDLVTYQWAALYSADTESGIYRLRRGWQQGENTTSHDKDSGEGVPSLDKSVTTMKKAQVFEEQTSIWPPQVSKGEGYLGQVVASGQPPAGVDFHLPSHPAFLYFPLQFRETIIGLLAIARPGRWFRERERARAEVLAVVIAEKLRSIQRIEEELERLLSIASQFARHPERLEKIIRELTDRRVDVSKILAQIAERTFQNNLRAVLKDVVTEGTSGREKVFLSDDELCAIYDRVRQETLDMPPLDDDILEKLKIVPSDLTSAFSFRFQWPAFDRGVAYKELYAFFAQALDVQSTSEIRNLYKMARDTLDQVGQKGTILPQIITQFNYLVDVMWLVKQSQEATTTEQQRKRLVEAISKIEDLANQSENLDEPERFIFRVLIADWFTILSSSQHALERGGAQLKLKLRTESALPMEHVTVVLVVKNEGQGAASRLVAEMRSSPDYQSVGQSRIELGILSPLQSKESEFTLRPKAESQLRIEFQVTYRDREREQKQELFADVLRLRATPPPFTQIFSPYVAGRPLRRKSEIFFGRQDVFEFIKQNLVPSVRQQQALLLIGVRRMGKTSILRQLPERLKDELYVHVFFDCQRIPTTGGMSGFFLRLSAAISEGLKEAGVSITSLSPTDLGDHPQYTFEERFLPRVWKRIGDRPLLLAVDELEELEVRIRGQRLEPEVFSYLRSLIQCQDKMAFILVGTPGLEERIAGHESALFNIAKTKRVSFLEEEQAVELITAPVLPYGMVYDDLALNEILRLTACHPYFLQLVCDCLVKHCNAKERNYVTVQDVRDMQDRIMEEGQEHLAFVWEQSFRAEKVVLAAMASLLRSQQQVTTGDILEHLARHIGNLAGDVGFDLQVVTQQALDRLISRETVREIPGATSFYEFTALLYGKWISKYKSLNKILPALIKEVARGSSWLEARQVGGNWDAK